MTLENLRKEIDQINIQIIALLAKRVELTRKVASLKKDHKAPLVDLHREILQYRDLKKVAEKYHLQPEIVEEIFALIIKYCKTKMREEIQ
jgi:chorismate mutase